MTWLVAKPVPPRINSTDMPSIRVSRRTDGVLRAELFMGRDVQTLLFERSIVGERLKVEVGVEERAGLLRIALSPDGIEVGRYLKSSSRTIFAPWKGATPTVRKVSCQIVERNDQFAVLKMLKLAGLFEEPPARPETPAQQTARLRDEARRVRPAVPL